MSGALCQGSRPCRRAKTLPRVPIQTRRSAQRPRQLAELTDRPRATADRSCESLPAGREPQGVTQGEPPGAACRGQRSGRGRGHHRARLQSAQAGHVELGRYTRRDGVHGKMTGAQAAAAALWCHGVPCVFGIPGAQNNEFWDALKARGVPYLLVTHEASASVMADAAARATGTVGVFAVVPGPGLTNALTGIGEALYDSIPIVGLVTDIDRSPNAKIGQVHGLANAAIMQPVVKAVIEVRHQAEIPQAIFQAFQIAAAGEPGPVGVLIPYPLYSEVWNFDLPVPPPMPAAIR